MEDLGFRGLEHSYVQVPVMLAQLKDEDPGVARQAIASFTKLFHSILQELAQQFHRHAKVERWAEEAWMQMIEFKDVVLSLVFEPASVGTRLLALKFLETCILLFTPDVAGVDRLTSGGKDNTFNVSWLASDHPVLDPAKLISEANRLSTSLLDMLQSSNSIPGPLTITIVNCLASIARKRPGHYSQVLSALLDFHSNSETRGHTASLQYSVRSALLGFLRCTHPVIFETRERLVQELRLMNAGDAVDQVLRQVDKLMRNNERHSRDARVCKDEQPSTQRLLSGDPIKRKLLPVENEEPENGLEMVSKRMRYTFNGKSPDVIQNHGSVDDDPVVNGISSEAPLVDSNVNPVEQMIAVIAALLAEGERAAESLELLISQIHPDLLADIVITNMKHLPKTAPVAKQGILPSTAPSISAASAVQGIDSSSLPVHSSLSAQQGTISAAVTVSTSLPDFSGSANLQVDSRRDPRRDPRRLDPRRVAGSVETLSLPVAEEATHVSSVLEATASVNRSTTQTSVTYTEHNFPHSVPDADVDVKNIRTLLVPEKEVMPKEEEADESREILSISEVNVLINHAISPDHAVNENSVTLTSLKMEHTEPASSSFFQESDDDTPPISNSSACEDTCKDFPEVPSYVYLTEKQRQTVKKLAMERIVKSYKQLKDNDLCRTRMSLIARLVSWMGADDLVTMTVQQDIVLDYRDQQGHDLVMHVLYHLYGLITIVGEQSSGAADLYEKFLLGVAKSLLDTLPASDKSFSRLLGEAPMLTDSVMRMLENLCSPDGSDTRGKDIRDDRVTQGLGAVWSLILGRPLNRQACLSIALKCATHSDDDTRTKAIRLVSQKLYQLTYVSETIEQYAKNMLLSAVDCATYTDVPRSTCFKREAGFGEETSICGPRLDSGTSHAVSQAGGNMSFPEAQCLISLYFSLCTKKPSLLQLVFDVYARAGKIVKQAIHRHITILLRALGSSNSQLLRIISDPPTGSENLLMLVLQILAEQATPPPDLVSTVKHLYETKLKDATILIPMLSSLSKNEVLPIFPRLVDLPLDKFQQALAHILQGSAHTGPALTPAEVLVAIHDIVPEKEKIALKKVTDACSACFEQRTVFTQHVLAKALNQMVDRTPLPLLFMRTVIQAIDAFPTLVEFVMEVLSKLVSRQIWRMPKLWVGFLKCVSQTQPHSFHVLLKLPTPQLESALNKYANLRGPLATYSSQPSIKSSLPSSTLAVLGLTSETRMTQTHLAAPVHTSDTSSVRGATST